MSNRHGPTTLTSYVNAHNGQMARLIGERVVVRDDCGFTEMSDHVLLNGPIYCEFGGKLEVDKRLVRLGGSSGNAKVQTVKLSYHAVRHGLNIFRYNVGDHRPYPHKHVYDFFGNGEEIELKKLEAVDVPTLDAVIEELHNWLSSNSRRLP